jgi:transposase-like protein
MVISCGKQNYQCSNCGRQFIEYYFEVGYSKKVKEDCLTMYLNGNGFRAIERITQVNHNTVIRWVCYSKSEEMLFLSIQLLIYYLKEKNLSQIN